MTLYEGMKVDVLTGPLDGRTPAALVLGLFSDERPPRGFPGEADWHLNGLVSRLLAAGKISAVEGEQVAILPRWRLSPKTLLLIGLGSSDHLGCDSLHEAGRTIAGALTALALDDFAVDIPGAGRCSLPIPAMASSLLRGMADQFDRIKRGKRTVSARILGEKHYVTDIFDGINEFHRS